MRFKSLVLVVSALSFATLVGCKSKCESNCDEMSDKDCDNADHDDCLHLCIMEDDMEQDTDKCTQEFDDLMSCISDQSDICKVLETDTDTGKLKKCNSESEDYAKCFADYCADHDKRDYCM
jgi:hypothetical protein